MEVTDPPAQGDEVLLHAVLAACGEAFVLADEAGRIVDWNPAAERAFGHERAEVLGLPLGEVLIPPAMRAMHQEGLERFVRTGESRIIGRRIEVTALHRQGREVPVEMVISAVQVAGGGWRFAALLHDISPRRAAEATTRRLAAIVDTVDAGAVAVGLDGAVETWNAGAVTILGRTAEATVGMPLRTLFAPGGEAGADRLLQRALDGEVVRADTVFTHADGHEVPVALSLTALLDPTRGAGPAGASLLFRDITRHKVAEARLAAYARRQRELARRDDLTGLLNARALTEGLDAALRRGAPFSVVAFDLEGLAALNARSGPEAGDALLRAFARRLEGRGEGAWAARIAGDEFALVLPATDRHAARAAGREVAAATAATGDGVEVRFGVATSSAGARSAGALLHGAERDRLSRAAG